MAALFSFRGEQGDSQKGEGSFTQFVPSSVGAKNRELVSKGEEGGGGSFTQSVHSSLGAESSELVSKNVAC